MAGSYTLSFKDSGSSSDNSTKRTTVADIVATGAGYVSAVEATNVYNARVGRGIKLGTSSATGSLELTLGTPVKATSIVVCARRYNDNERTLKIQDKDFEIDATKDSAECTYTYEAATEISKIALASTEKRNYLISVTVNFEGENPDPDPEPEPAKNLGEKTIAEFLALKSTTDTCVLTGIVDSLVNTTYGNFNLVDATAKVYVYGLLTPAGESKKFAELDIIEGDTLTVKALYGEYKGNPQAPNAIFVSVKRIERQEPIAADTLTCAKAAEDALAGKTDEVLVKGYVTDIAFAWANDSMSFWMADTKDGGKVLEAYKCAIAKEEDAVIVGDLVVAKGKLKDYVKNDVHTPELDAGCTVEIIEKAERPDPQPIDADTITVAKAIELTMALDSAATSEKEYVVKGFVVDAQDFSWGSKQQIFFLADDAANAGAQKFEAYYCTAFENGEAIPVLNGDEIYLLGKLTKYFDKNANDFLPEIKNGKASFISKVDGDRSKPEAETITVAKALEIAKDLEIGATSAEVYTVVGYVTAMAGKNADGGWEQYGNQMFWIADAEGSTAASNADGAFEVYQGVADEEVKVGYKISVYTKIRKYNDGSAEGLIESEAKAPVTILEKPAGPELPDGVISCDSAVALAKTIEDPVEVKSTVEGPAVKVWGYVTYAYNASEKDGIVKQSAWLSDVKDSNSGVIQGAYLEIASMESAVVKGDYVQIEGTLAKYLKEGKDGKPNEIVIEVINGKMAKVSELGIENIELTVKAQKVIVDGVLYIIRDNKMYNVQGLQVR